MLVRKVAKMNDQCPFKNNGNCDVWLDYQIALWSLEEAEELSHGNWIEIQHLRNRIDLLEEILKNAGIDVPPGY